MAKRFNNPGRKRLHARLLDKPFGKPDLQEGQHTHISDPEEISLASPSFELNSLRDIDGISGVTKTDGLVNSCAQDFLQ